MDAQHNFITVEKEITVDANRYITPPMFSSNINKLVLTPMPVFDADEYENRLYRLSLNF